MEAILLINIAGIIFLLVFAVEKRRNKMRFYESLSANVRNIMLAIERGGDDNRKIIRGINENLKRMVLVMDASVLFSEYDKKIPAGVSEYLTKKLHDYDTRAIEGHIRPTQKENTNGI